MEREENLLVYSFLCAIVMTALVALFIVVRIGLSVAPPPVATGYWMAKDSAGVLHLLKGIPEHDGTYSGEWWTLAHGENVADIAAITVTITGAQVTLTVGETGAQYTGHITGVNLGASMTFPTLHMAFHACTWDDWRNATLHH